MIHIPYIIVICVVLHMVDFVFLVISVLFTKFWCNI